MHGVGGGVACDFCDVDAFRTAEVFLEDHRCVFAATSLDSAVLPGAGIVVPRAHRESPFELDVDEWVSTRALLVEARAVIDERLRPDGWTIGWNVGAVGGQEVAHAHLHVIPRFGDEPDAGRGLRWWLKQPDNARADPAAPGHRGAP